jgi:hypothetical protein
MKENIPKQTLSYMDVVLERVIEGFCPIRFVGEPFFQSPESSLATFSLSG